MTSLNLEKLEIIKTIRSKAYLLSRATSQLKEHIDEVKKGRALISEGRKILRDLDVEEKKYVENLREIRADVAAVSQTLEKLEGHVHTNEEASVKLLSRTCQPNQLVMNKLLESVGLPHIHSSPGEDEVTEWKSQLAKTKRKRTRTCLKLQNQTGSSKDDHHYQKKVKQCHGSIASE